MDFSIISESIANPSCASISSASSNTTIRMPFTGSTLREIQDLTLPGVPITTWSHMTPTSSRVSLTAVWVQRMLVYFAIVDSTCSGAAGCCAYAPGSVVHRGGQGHALLGAPSRSAPPALVWGTGRGPAARALLDPRGSAYPAQSRLFCPSRCAPAPLGCGMAESGSWAVSPPGPWTASQTSGRCTAPTGEGGSASARSPRDLQPALLPPHACSSSALKPRSSKREALRYTVLGANTSVRISTVLSSPSFPVFMDRSGASGRSSAARHGGLTSKAKNASRGVGIVSKTRPGDGETHRRHRCSRGPRTGPPPPPAA